MRPPENLYTDGGDQSSKVQAEPGKAKAGQHSELGGARISKGLLSINYTRPMARITVMEEGISLRISGLLRTLTYEVPKHQIEKITDYEGIFSKGIQIVHHCTSAPELLVFWTSHRQDLKATIRGLGYPVEE